MNFSTSVLNVFFRYPSDCLMYLFAVMAMICLMYRSSKKRRELYLLLTAFSILLIFNPICFKIVGYFGLAETYYRFLWAVPITFIITAFIVYLVKESYNRCAKLAILFTISVCIMLGRTGDYIGAHMSSENNIYGFRDDIIEISDIIEADACRKEPTVLTDEYVFSRLRCYNANIVYRVPRNYYLNDRIGENGYYTEDGTGNPALVRMEQLGERTDEETMGAILEELNVDYIIIKSEFDMGEYLNKFNYVLLGTTDIYEVYKSGTEVM